MLRLALALALLAACSPPGPPPATGDAPASQATPTARPSEPAPSAPAPGASTSPASASAASHAPTTPASSAAADPSVGAACVADADCRWDDPCTPQRCVGGRAETADCEKSSPPPGACLCVARQCALKPSRMPAPAGACEPGGCVLDRAAGRCVADAHGTPPNLRSTPPVETGPSCDCITPAKGCEMTWFEPVACKTNRDCWISPTPRTHPIARPARFKGRDFKPCADGEVAPACGGDGFCTVGRAYKC
ncbi:MAG TPA: hypothetical protein VFS00_09185 [Polyangiaceae bacterium]|nr:hypothetical protein [Polyangiaceae bacterium]